MSIRVRSPADFLPEIERIVGKPVTIYRLDGRYRRVSPHEFKGLKEAHGEFGVRVRRRREILGNLRYVKPSDGKDGVLQYRGSNDFLEAVWTSSEDAA
ncbi:MAG: hypothetical protein HY368_02015 [Candidatus Aenigmarchaeota archaeon]|nr:hypothetical protein [Candidatus Aenigmarchaeota archaeon]